MKKKFYAISILALLVAMLMLSSCAVSPYMGSITAQNNDTSVDALNVSVGNVYIGYVAHGTTVTVYFTTPQNNAPVTAINFVKETGTSGKIDLKLDHQYQLYFSKNQGGDNKEDFVISGQKLGNTDFLSEN